MTKRQAASVLGFLLLAAGGCASTPEVAHAPVVSQSARLGAGDAIGYHLDRTDRAIAGSEARDRTVASHPDD